MARAIQTFEVSLKAFIILQGRALFVREADTGYWELPGGRIDVGEETDDHETILTRELIEELGPGFRVEIGSGAVTWTRRRPLDGAFLFLMARICHAVGASEPQLSFEHDDYAWLSADAVLALRLPPESGYPAGIAELFRRAALQQA